MEVVTESKWQETFQKKKEQQFYQAIERYDCLVERESIKGLVFWFVAR